MKRIKHYIIGAIMIFTIATPSFAQTTSHDLYISALQQVIALLQQQVQLLVQQLAALSDNQVQITSTLERIQNPIVPTAPTFGNVSVESPIPTTIKIDQTDGGSFTGNIIATCSLQGFAVSVLDQNGNPIEEQEVIFTNPDTGKKVFSTTTPAGSFNNNKLIKANVPDFTPQQVRMYDLTFTSGNLSKTIRLNSRSWFSYYRNNDGTFRHVSERKGDYLRTDEGLIVDANTGSCVSSLIYNNL